jgi:hypothetical protein
MHAGTSLTAAGIGMVAVVWSAMIVRHNVRHGMKAYRGALFFALVAGLCLSASIAAYVGALIGTQVAGIAIIVLIVTFGLPELIFMMRGHGHHEIWTPALGLVVALAIPLCPGIIGHFGQGAGTHLTNIVHGAGTHVTGVTHSAAPKAGG